MGRFVEITISHPGSREHARAVVRSCPVDIFSLDPGGELVTIPEREDECLLCGRCIAAATDAITVTRAYGAHRPVPAGERGSDA